MTKLSIKLIVLDADGTIWDHKDASLLSPPFTLVSETSAIDSQGAKVTLIAGIPEFLKEAIGKGAIVALASWNRPDPVFKLLEIFGLLGYFSYVIAEPHPEKHRMIVRILRSIEEKGVSLRPEEILYVDDRDIHIGEVRSSVGDIRFLIMGKDIRDWNDGLSLVSPLLV